MKLNAEEVVTKRFKYMYVNHTYMYINHTPLNIAELKVLEVFLDLNRHYFAETTKKTKLTRPRTLRVLRRLKEINILIVEDRLKSILNDIKLFYDLQSLRQLIVTFY